jgi:hypothetical protein
MKTIKLWVDDIRPMPSGFNTWAKTAQQAIETLKRYEVVEISLDHDLGEGCGTGYEVAKFIEERAYRGTKPPAWAVHSANPVGAQNMKMAMTAAWNLWFRYHEEKQC